MDMKKACVNEEQIKTSSLGVNWQACIRVKMY